MTTVRSPFFYVGDKYKLITQIKSELPKKITRFLSLSVAAAVFFSNIEADEYHLNDINSNVIELHKFLFSYKYNEDIFFAEIKRLIDFYGLSASFWGKIAPEDLRKKYVKTYYAKFNKDAYIKLRNDYNKDKTKIILLYLLLIYGFNHMIRFNSNGDFNLPVGNVDFNNNVEKSLRAYFKAARQKKVFFYNLDFQYFIEQFEFNKEDVIYLDPPYLITFSEYNKLWNDEEEYRLLTLLDNINGSTNFAISNLLFQKGKYNAIFNLWAQKYKIIDVKSNYISYHDNTIKDSVEVLVKNF